MFNSSGYLNFSERRRSPSQVTKEYKNNVSISFKQLLGPLVGHPDPGVNRLGLEQRHHFRALLNKALVCSLGNLESKAPDRLVGLGFIK